MHAVVRIGLFGDESDIALSLYWIVEAVEPQLGDTVEAFGRIVVATLKRGVQAVDVGAGVDLHVATDLEHVRPLGDERRVRLTPVALELLDAQVRPPTQAERQLDHENASSSSADPNSVLP